MSDFLKIKHSFNAGDAITILPGLRKLWLDTGKKTVFYQVLNLPAFYYEGAIHPVQYNGQNVCMNDEMWGKLKPLLLHQPYIQDALIWEGQEVDINFDESRDRKYIPMPCGDIYHWPWALQPKLACDLSEPFLTKSSSKYALCKNYAIINKTERYYNPYISYYFLREHQDRVVFVGTEKEKQIFCDKWGIAIKHLHYDDFNVLLNHIASCKLFLGNQSMCWHIAEGLKIPRILEGCPQFPNCYPHGANGYHVTYQKAMEYHFNKLIQ